MEVIISDAALFRRALEALREFLPQAQVFPSEEGLRISGMDASHVGFVDFFLSAEDCTSMKCKNGSPPIGISVNVLSRMIAGASDSLSIIESGDRLKVSFKTEGRSANYELSTLHIQADTVQLPELNYSATVKAKSSDIASLIKDLALFGDQVTLCLDEDGFHVRAEGDVGKADLTLEPSDEREMNLEGADSVEVGFGMKYLQQIMKHVGGLTMYTELAFDDGQPLRVTSRFGKASHFIAYLAPKIQDD